METTLVDGQPHEHRLGDELCRELLRLADTLRQDVHSQVELVVEEHSKRLARWAESSASGSAGGRGAGAVREQAWVEEPAEQPTADADSRPGTSPAAGWSGPQTPAGYPPPRSPNGTPPHLAPRTATKVEPDDGDGSKEQPSECGPRWAAAAVHDEAAAPPGLVELADDAEPTMTPLARDAEERVPSKRQQLTTYSMEDSKNADRVTTVSHRSESQRYHSKKPRASHAHCGSVFEWKLMHMKEVKTEIWEPEFQKQPKTLFAHTNTAEIRGWMEEQRSKDCSAFFHEGEHERWHSPFCRKLVQSNIFDQTLGTVLVLNAVAIGVQVDWLARNNTTESPTIFRVFDYAFCSIFFLELVLRIAAGPYGFCRGREWKWNYFDSFVVLVQVVDEIVQSLRKSGSNPALEALDRASFVRMLRLFRLARFLRLVRLFPGLRSMVYLLVDCIGSFFWAVVMLMFLMFCMGVYFTELFTYVSDRSGDEDTSELRVYWGSVPQSVLSLFMAIFGGFDWKDGLDVFKTLDSDTYVLNTIVMSLYIAFTTLVMLNLVTGVFVDGATRIIKEDRDKELLRLTACIFAAADQDGSKDISDQEFSELLGTDLMENFCEVNNISIDEVDTLYRLLREGDRDEDGSVSVTQFVRGCKMLQGEARAADLQTVKLMCRQHFERTEERFQKLHKTICDRLPHQDGLALARDPRVGRGDGHSSKGTSWA